MGGWFAHSRPSAILCSRLRWWVTKVTYSATAVGTQGHFGYSYRNSAIREVLTKQNKQRNIFANDTSPDARVQEHVAVKMRSNNRRWSGPSVIMSVRYLEMWPPNEDSRLPSCATEVVTGFNQRHTPERPELGT